MKKNTFIQGAFIATFAIFLSKIIGIIYVIPFYPLIGERGGALYGYAYSIYSLFLSLSTAGIPFAISKITSEYNALGFHYTKERSYRLGKYVISFLGIISFIVIMIFAKNIGYAFVGNIKGGNTASDVALVIRIISTALLIVPTLSVTRGYLQGHGYITTSSLSQIIEQIVRVSVLLIGTYLSLRVFNLPLKLAIGLAVFAATVGALIAYLFLYLKLKKNITEKPTITLEEKNIKQIEILKKILYCSIPFILIDFIRSCYNFVDLSTINKTMVALGYTITESESVVSVFSTWGLKLESILYALSTGLIISLVPNLSSSHVLNNKEDIKRKINSALQSLLFIALPLTVILSSLASPLWITFFGTTNTLGPSIFKFSIFVALLVTIFNTTVSILHSLSYSKIAVYSLLLGITIKIIFNVPLMRAFNSIKIHPSLGVILSNSISFLIPLLIIFNFLKKKLDIDYKETSKTTINIVYASFAVMILINILNLIIKIDISSRFNSLLMCIICGGLSVLLYIFIMIKNKTIYKIFGEDILKKITSKIKNENN